MLRNRPERCPYCDHDVRGRLLCGHCRQPMPISGSIEERDGWSRSYLPSERPWPRWMLPTLVSGVVAEILLVEVWPEMLYAIVVAPVLALVIAFVAPSIARVRRQLRGERVPTRLSEACERLATERDAIVTVRGHVRTELPASPFARYALWKGVGGRFFVVTSDGEAFVDDDRIEMALHERAGDGELVEVTGPARLEAEASEYRGSQRRVVFEGTSTEPLRIRVI
ncbi:MAG: hypothetical protein J0L92_15705 [Deltaproteobacteria bacterium]|nr:hypothetical protein [Deltaproteobacteria bacterium]